MQPHWIVENEQAFNAELGIDAPKEAFCVLSRIWEAAEASKHTARDLALPDTRPLSVSEYWRWFACGKCDVFAAGIALMLQSLLFDFGVALSHQGVQVVDYGTVALIYRKPFTPMLRVFAVDPKTQLPTDMDRMTNAAVHRVNYFKTSKGTVIFVDFTAAQYNNVPSLDHASCLPLLVMEGEEELAKCGFSVRRDSFLSTAFDEPDLFRSLKVHSGGSSQVQEGMMHLRWSLFHHVVTTQKLDLPTLMRTHPNLAPPTAVHCSGFDPEDRPRR